ncbi:MAG: 2-C-methyl-D-erythritol 4-phosphate cytidylyltransferase [bacterium]|nr:2-C-methyl-D-erythritol 4-phosphate cytidylyltransferase [candidate division KSB1 bacterium]MDH7560087.1 2-C-methyl-D-erythritol 4-phosphate cytidylyltransferase [bacterium]
MRTTVIVVAAGRSARFGSDTPKQFALVHGRPLLFYSLSAFQRMPLVDALIAVVPEGREQWVQEEIVDRFDLHKVVAVVRGGERRQDSVWAGLQAVPQASELVAIHDGARPLVNPEVVAAVLSAAEKHGAAIPGIRLADTIKEVQGGQVVQTLNRDRLIAVQTPQAFRYALLLEAYRAAQGQRVEVTDDAAMVERLGHPVWVVKGDPRAVKVTTPHDLSIVVQWLVGQEG